MIKVEYIRGRSFLIALDDNDLVQLRRIQIVKKVRFSEAMRNVIERGFIELTGELPENRSTDELG